MNNTTNNLALILQALSLEVLFKDYNNCDLMNELQQQDERYLKKIISQNELIINLLMERRNTNAGEVIQKNRGKY
jgi:hypothetical protein